MKKSILIIFGILLFSSFVTSEVIINSQPTGIYNLGDTISIPVTIKTVNKISGTFQMDLICNGHLINFYKNGVGLSAGEEQKMDSSLVLTKEIIGEIKGNCVVKSTLGEDYILSDEFKISDLIDIQITNEETEFAPGDYLILEGEATKENQEDVEGFIEFQIGTDNSTELITHIESINKGFFLANISIPKNMKAGTHTVNINAYEKDNANQITNQGTTSYNILIKQIPTSLEIVLEESKIEPGNNLRVKAILHDQTGEKIETFTVITIKNKKDKILEQTEIATDEFLEYPIKNNEPPSEWKIVAISNKLTSESQFQIMEKKEVNIEIINTTLTLTNAGNVPYNDLVLIKIGNESLNLNVSLKVDEVQKYILSAPDGEYQVEIMGISENVALTGNTIDVREASTGVISLVRYPIVWIFMIAILGFVAFTIFRKGYKRSFVGRIIPKKKQKDKFSLISLSKKSIIKTKNKAELSLSIKGEKQNASIVGLKIKNLKEIESKKSNAEEILQKVIDMAEGNKAAIYENQENIFFILAPIKTKTFKNEKNALEISQKTKEILNQHNKLAKQKINFGISMDYGTIIAKQEPNVLKFMSMGTLITNTKKISSLADNEILLGEKINERLTSEIKTEKQRKHKTPVYTIKQIKTSPKNHEKFIRTFLDRMEKK
ncbi:MAG: hypothetical protein KKF48_00390 [Nanoarchaeota archaeon]|nr:hypothetical protein [Nanoarchaeota archaeon]MBU1027483.1 hypothetical protein [Nanoarchaeota archaeon]